MLHFVSLDTRKRVPFMWALSVLMNCPECSEKLEHFDNIAFNKASDYATDTIVQFIIGLIFAGIVSACFAYSAILGFLVIALFAFFYYVVFHRSKNIWLCKSCNKKYIGQSLKSYESN